MKHITFSTDISKLRTAILIKENCLRKPAILANYVNPLIGKGIAINTLVAVDLKYGSNNKITAAAAKDYISVLLPALDKVGIDTLFCCDGTYFKYLTGNTKVTGFHGEVVPCKHKGFEHMNVILSVNYAAMDYNPNIAPKLELSLNTLATYLGGNHTALGSDIIHHEEYLKTADEVEIALKEVYKHPELTLDIEGRSLDFWTCGIATATLCWNKHEGIAFAVDRADVCEVDKIRKLFKEFLYTYKGKLTYHNAGFDIKVIVYELFMEHLQDYHGMLQGIDLLIQNFDDTKLIAYLATNNAVQNEIGLKPLGHEYSGNYAEDMTGGSDDVPIDRLLKYNLLDGLTTWFVKEKYEPIMDNDLQRDLYEDLFKPSVKTILQTELCGMPICPIKVQEAKAELTAIVDTHMDYFNNDPVIADFHHTQKQDLADQMTAKAKKKVYELDDPIIERFKFNPNSNKQLQGLIYGYLGYEVIDLTKEKQPATGKKTLEKLKANTKSDAHKELFDHLIALADADKILTTFIPAFERAQQLPDGSWRLYGNFNLGGTQSLRLSSSNPNLQNIPSGSVYAKLIKACFISTSRWIFCGSDFDSLESKVNALITKDPMQMKVYTDGFDGHSLRAFFYFRDQMPDIVKELDGYFD